MGALIDDSSPEVLFWVSPVLLAAGHQTLEGGRT